MNEQYRPETEQQGLSSAEFYEQLKLEDRDEAYRKQTTVRIRDNIDTVIIHAAKDEDEVVVRATNIDGGNGRFDFEIFRGDDRVHYEAVDISEGEAPRFSMQGEIDLSDDERFSEEFREGLSGYRMHPSRAILVADMGEVQTVGTENNVTEAHGLSERVSMIIHKSGRMLSFRRRTGREDDGEHLEGEDVMEIEVMEPNGDFESIVDKEENFDIEARAGSRAVIKRRIVAGAGAAALISAGVATSVMAYNRFKRK